MMDLDERDSIGRSCNYEESVENGQHILSRVIKHTFVINNSFIDKIRITKMDYKTGNVIDETIKYEGISLAGALMQ